MHRLLKVVALNNNSFSQYGPWAVAIDSKDALRYTQMYSPVFSERFAAEVFAEVASGRIYLESNEDELALARDIEKFIQSWEDAHADDAKYPTPDGRYPCANLMCEWYVEAPARRQLRCVS